MRSALCRVIASILVLVRVVPVRGEDPRASETNQTPFEIQRILVPEGQVRAAFPSGASLRAMPEAALQDLVESARQGFREAAAHRLPRLIRARHEVQWLEGQLKGSSELIVDAAGASAGVLDLFPWTPAVFGRSIDADEASLLTGADEVLKLEIRPGDRHRYHLAWELNARPGSNGLAFLLGLPQCPISELRIALPEKFTPEGFPGSATEITETKDGGLRHWTFHGPIGPEPLDVRLRESVPAEANHRVWLSGRTSVDVQDGSARWLGEWSVEFASSGPEDLIFGISPELSIVAVNGPTVDYFTQFTDESGVKWLRIRVARRLEGSTPISIQAVASVPGSGSWVVPWIEPVGMTWIGGRATIRIGPERLVEACRALTGPAIAPLPEDLKGDSTPTILAFSSIKPGPIAELILRESRVDASVEVVGRVEVSRETLSFQADLFWSFRQGSLLTMRLEHPVDWQIDNVSFSDSSQSFVPWQIETGDQSQRILVINVPPTLDPSSSRSLTLTILAHATGGNRSESFSLPRLRPLDARIVDERWTANCNHPVILRPLDVHGLAWSSPEGLGFPEHTKIGSVGLAWRWLTTSGRGRAELVRDESSRTVLIYEQATISGSRLVLEITLSIDAREQVVESLPIALNIGTLDREPVWRLRTGDLDRPLRTRGLTERERNELGLQDIRGPSWIVDLGGTRRGRFEIQTHVETLWSGSGSIPIAQLDRSFQPRGQINVVVAESMLSRARSTGLIRVDSERWNGLNAPGVLSSSTNLTGGASRIAHAYVFGLDKSRAELVVETEQLQAASADGLIRDAMLFTNGTEVGSAFHRLLLKVVSTGAQSLEVTFEERAKLHRVLVDGRPILPSRRGRAILVPIVGQSPSRPFTLVELEYEDPSSLDSERRFGGGVIWPPLPVLSLPCLNFSSELHIHDGLVDVPSTSESLANEDEDPGSWGSAVLAIRPPLRNLTRRTNRVIEVLDSLATRLPKIAPEGIALGDLLTRWDAGEIPIVIDRLGLAASGWGTRSRVSPPASPPGDGRATRDWLRSIGLDTLELDRCVLLTTREQAESLLHSLPGDTERLLDIRTAASDGSGMSDRFQSVDRWLGEDPIENRFGGNALSLGGSRASQWFTTVGWPMVPNPTILPHPLSSLWSWAVGLAVLSVGIATREVKPRLRLWSLIVLAVSLLGVKGLGQDVGIVEVSSRGAFWGGLGCCAFWMGHSLRSRQAASNAQRGWIRGRGTGASGPGLEPYALSALMMIFLGLGAIEPRSDSIPEPGEAPIRAIVPHDGNGRPLGQTWISREDDDRLRFWASQAKLALEVQEHEQRLWLRDAVHEVRVEGESLILESQLQLELMSEAPVAWPLDLGQARYLGATLDGHVVPIGIRQDGRVAEVWIKGYGKHLLVVRSRLTPEPSPKISSFPIPVLPTSRAVVRGNKGPTTLEISSARGGMQVLSGGDVEYRLGPTRELQINWRNPEVKQPPSPQGQVEGVMLWDAMPTGDRIRARFRYRDVQSLATLRVRLEPHMEVQSVEVPNLVNSRLDRTSQAPVCVVHIDPPSNGDVELFLDIWRPASAELESFDGTAEPRQISRTLPRIEPLAAQHVQTTVGFRRPSYWSGRLEEIEGVEQITDEQFVQLWGNLPDTDETLAGAIRFRSTPDDLVHTGREVVRTLVRPSVQIEIQPGRLAFRADAELNSLDGTNREFLVGLPDSLVLTNLSGDGLSHWSRTQQGQLRLRFDGSQLGRGVVHMEGWIPVESGHDPLNAEPHKLRIPWPDWIDCEQLDGELVLSVVGKISFNLQLKNGIELNTTQDTAILNNPREITSLRIGSQRDVGHLSWTEEGTKSYVVAHSLLTVHPEVAELESSLHYRVTGGPLRRMIFSIPTAWASEVEAQAVGLDRAFDMTTRDNLTIFSMELKEPVWCSQEVRIRAIRPFDRSLGLSFPDIVPLMRKEQQQGFETYLMLADASGYDLSPAGSARVQAIDASRFASGPIEPPRNARIFAYYVLQDGWEVSIPASSVKVSSDVRQDPTATPIRLADITCLVEKNGNVRGEAHFVIGLPTKPFLGLRWTEDIVTLAATVDQRPVRPMHSSSGEWLIPLGSSRVRDVSIIWETKPRGEVDLGRLKIPLPLSEQTSLPTLITIFAPKTCWVDGAISPASADMLALQRAESLAAQIMESLDPQYFDRSSAADRARLLGMLVRFELLVRTTVRAAALGHSSPDRDPDQGPDSVLTRLEALRRELSSHFEVIGLEDFTRSARIRVGLESTPDPLVELPIGLESPALLRLRPVGHPWYFRLPENLVAGNIPLIVRWNPLSQSSSASRASLLATACGVVICGLTLDWIVSRITRRTILVGAIGLLVGAAWVSLPASGLLLVALLSGRLIGR